LPALANARDRIPGAPWLGQRAFGIASRRSLPRWRRDSFLRAASPDGARESDADVVLFVDTFNNYFEPENARAAHRVLRASGYRVHLARPSAGDGEPRRPLCCGRTYLAAGMVEEAKHEARRMLRGLAPFLLRRTPIVGLEPACLLSFRDEYRVLGLGDGAQRLSESAWLLEEFLSREHRAGRLKLALAPLRETRALVHGHCHQKAFDAFDPALAVLKLVPGLGVEPIESSCCGMAGTFGFDASHYDVSMRMAELSLLPAVRAASSDTLIVADGTSCRHQISDGTKGQRTALHAARVLERALQGATEVRQRID